MDLAVALCLLQKAESETSPRMKVASFRHFTKFEEVGLCESYRRESSLFIWIHSQHYLKSTAFLPTWKQDRNQRVAQLCVARQILYKNSIDDLPSDSFLFDRCIAVKSGIFVLCEAFQIAFSTSDTCISPNGHNNQRLKVNQSYLEVQSRKLFKISEVNNHSWGLHWKVTNHIAVIFVNK